jgi:hypothetical protein
MATLVRPLKPEHSRALALGLLFVAVFLGLAVLLAPFLLLHQHYNAAIDAAQERLDQYRSISAQGPVTQKALDALREKQGRRFFLKNTAANLAGAELQDLVRAAIENRATMGGSARLGSICSCSPPPRTCRKSSTRSKRSSPTWWSTI